jgi:hypothetical protein
LEVAPHYYKQNDLVESGKKMPKGVGRSWFSHNSEISTYMYQTTVNCHTTVCMQIRTLLYFESCSQEKR